MKTTIKNIISKIRLYAAGLITDQLVPFVATNKKEIIKYAIIGILLIMSIVSIKKCSSYKYDYKVNIAALTDTISYYKSKQNNLVTEKTMLQGDVNLLKKVNDSLYNKIKEMRIKNPDNVVYINTTVHDKVHDTCWVVNVDSIYYNNNYIERKFDFSDKYRTLYGYTYFKRDTLGTVIEKNETQVDFTVVQNDNKVYITSNNPYIKYNNIVGITLNETQKTKSKRWGVGPYIGFGVSHKFDFVPTVGVSLHWSFIQF